MRMKRAALLTPVALAVMLATPLPGGAAPSGTVTEKAAATEDSPDALSGPSSADPETVALGFMVDNAADYGLSADDVAELGVATSYQSTHSGVTHVNLAQRYQGLEIFGARATVNVLKDGRVLFVGNTMLGNVAASAAGTVAQEAADAVESAAEALELDEPENLRAVTRKAGAERETVLTDGGISAAPIPAKLGWQRTESGQLRLAWQVVIDDAESPDVLNATVDAETGDLLDVDNWTIEHNALELASSLARSSAQIEQAATSLGAHGPLDPVEDGSSYRVYEIPKESPNDGPRTLVTNPAETTASPFGWHDTNGAPGPEFTTTRGNNVHAYLDQDANNVPDPGQDTDGGPSLAFDFEADLTEHAQDYRDAVTANLFYMNNVIHDVLYGYGFDEVSGNFQQNKYGATLANGNPVPGGDYVRAEAADGGGTNNANFSTPANYGGTPRMQMYLWPGAQFGMPNVVTVGDQSFPANFARFGPPARNAAVIGDLVVAGNGCNIADYPAGSGYIAVVDGVTSGAGSCTNPARTAVAEAAGAAAVIIAAGTAANPAILTGSQAAGPLGIPAVSVTAATGTAIKDLAGQSAGVAKASAHPGIRDGDFENGIIIHEYGHGVSLRLTGGPGINCLSGNEQMGEGWSDYLAISMLMDPTLDDPEGPRGMGPYALFQDSREGNGIRPRPYSRNMEIQPFTYDRIKTNGWITGGSLAVPHGIGHAWAATLWDMTWDLVDRHGFHDNVYDAWNSGGNTRAIQYVMDGLKFQGCGPGFVTGRNAIIAASGALGGEDSCLIWSSFARRGLGYSAVQGTTNRDDNTEAFDVPPWCKAPGAGLVGPQFQNAPALNVRDAGSTAPIQFTLGGNLGLDVLKPNHSPASQQIGCDTLQPLQYAITTPTDGPGATTLQYNARQDRYTYLWETQESWVDTCRQLIITLGDGTQHRANFKFVAPED